MSIAPSSMPTASAIAAAAITAKLNILDSVKQVHCIASYFMLHNIAFNWPFLFT